MLRCAVRQRNTIIPNVYYRWNSNCFDLMSWCLNNIDLNYDARCWWCTYLVVVSSWVELGQYKMPFKPHFCCCVCSIVIIFVLHIVWSLWHVSYFIARHLVYWSIACTFQAKCSLVWNCGKIELLIVWAINEIVRLYLTFQNITRLANCSQHRRRKYVCWTVELKWD